MKLTILSCIGLLLASSGYTQAKEPTKLQKDYCPTAFSQEVCQQYIELLQSVLTTNPQSIEEWKTSITNTVEAKVKDPALLNTLLSSPTLKKQLTSIPLDLTFKMLDRKNSDSVLGVEFSYSHNFTNTVYDTQGKRQSGYQSNFKVNGTITQNKEENPHNFIEAKYSFFGSSYPTFNLTRIKSIINEDFCESAEGINDKECGQLLSHQTQELFSPMGLTYYLDYGVELGYETDQALEANNKTISAFIFGSYEDFRRNTFLGLNNIKPAFRLAIDTVKPSNETPRAMAGDITEYQRVSGEFSLVVPLTKLAQLPYAFTYNFRAYKELSASDIVKNSDLENYNLRTYSLTSPNGLILSYSSGRLPFGIKEENTVELGYQTYF